MVGIDFQKIVPHCGGQRESFEEPCCQLAHRRVSPSATFIRLHGAGGDGGVECFSDLPNGNRVGWQAKYVFSIEALLTQATKSIETALKIHPTLTKYIVCFPFDLTGPTARRGQSSVEKFTAWRKEQIESAAKQGRKLEIEAWAAAKLRSDLIELDVSGGISRFFFDETVLSLKWFTDHLDIAKDSAGPRYTADLNVHTVAGKWFASFGATTEWSDAYKKLLKEAKKQHDRFKRDIVRTGDRTFPDWPAALKPEAEAVAKKSDNMLDKVGVLSSLQDPTAYRKALELIREVVVSLQDLEVKMTHDLEQRHGKGKANSPGFRQFMSEYEVSFPAANLDAARDVLKAMSEMQDWFRSPEGALVFEKVFVLSGEWGVGKTHGVCDIATHRLEQGLLSCIVFGHQFNGDPDPWTRFIESLGLPTELGKNGLLDALSAAAEASGHTLIVFIDAINETRPIQYWHTRLRAFIDEFSKRPNLRLCITCRTPYLPICLPEKHALTVVTHPGFKGVEQIACRAFFKHYGLTPPVSPILQPELANPLYLKLVCETLQSLGIKTLPAGWSSMAQVIAAFLGAREEEFSREKGVSASAKTITVSLQGIARSLAESGQTSLNWKTANGIVKDLTGGTPSVLEWLVGANLLIEEPAPPTDGLDGEATVRLSFERLGDFLIALELLNQLLDKQVPLDSVFKEGGQLNSWIKNKESIEQNQGVLSALSILLPEKRPGLELSELGASENIRNEVVKIVLTSIPWRDPGSLSEKTRRLVVEALKDPDLCEIATDSLLSISCKSSIIDARWLHGLLKRMDLSQRDGYWCGYLHMSYEKAGPVKTMIDESFNLPLNELNTDTAERWTIVLLWFSAAADCRIKDRSTRGIIKILSVHPLLIPGLVSRFLDVNDDKVIERLLLSVYGALILCRDVAVLTQVTGTLEVAFRADPLKFDNALIRDEIRCISELASQLKVLPEGCDPGLTMQPVGSSWPLTLPTEEEVQQWGKLIFRPNEFSSDFFKYSMNCLSPWLGTVSKENIGKLILKRIIHDFAYESSNCQNYDQYMVGKYGGGRAKPNWAERIGKKYQWIALYQLASRLYDHVTPKKEQWDPEKLCKPFILLDGRKMDPTLFIEKKIPENPVPWWRPKVDLDNEWQLTDEEWVASEGNIPPLQEFLSLYERDGQRWRLLTAFPDWGHREDPDSDKPYRNAWMHIQGYLVDKKDFDKAYRALHRRNFFGNWMPAPPFGDYGFVGEYPWASPFNLYKEELQGGGRVELPVRYQPAWYSLSTGWKYDASSAESSGILIPGRAFFAPNDLWWNGEDGYCLRDSGRTVFRDASMKEGGDGILFADEGALLKRLDKLGLRLIWTILGEKRILGEGLKREQSPT